jgi:DNA polymerase I-like protein with 3'-5' exonuclease and polymerase domains
VLPQLSRWNPKAISVDVETCDPQLEELGPGPRRDGYIVGLAVGVEAGPRMYLPIRHQGGGNMDPDLIMGWARSELNAFTGRVVGANITYDLDFLAEEGVTFDHVAGFDDVLVAEPLIDEHKRGRYNLDHVAFDNIGERKVQDHLKQLAIAHGLTTESSIKKNLWRFSGADVGAYGEGDADLPLRVLPVQLAKLAADDQLHCYDMERRLIPLLLAMRRRGVRVNLDKADYAIGLMKKEFERWRSEVKRHAGARAEPGENDSLARAIQDRGLSYKMTKGGTKVAPKPQIDKFFLERNKGDKLVDAIAAARRVFYLQNNFLKGLFRHHVKGRIHCTFNQTAGDEGGTVGTRFSASDMNLQAVATRESEWDDIIDMGGMRVEQLIRGIFEPDEGEIWEQDDYSQVELRLGVHFAVGRGAEEARAKYRNDPKTDFHKLCAEMMGVDPEDKIRRKRVKNLNFARGYGAQAPKLAETFNCSIPEAEEFMREYNIALPFMDESLTTAAKWAQKRGYVVTIDGRKQRFPFFVPAYKGRNETPLRIEAALKKYVQLDGAGREVPVRLIRAKDYVAWNRKLQSSAGELMKYSMLRAWEGGLCEPGALGAFLLTVHDELDSSVPKTVRGFEAARELKNIMTSVFKLKVPIMVGSGRGDSWGTCVEEDDAKVAQTIRDSYWRLS